MIYTFVLMEKILSKKQTDKKSRMELLAIEYKALRESGSKSWAVVEHLAIKHSASATTIYRDLKEANAI